MRWLPALPCHWNNKGHTIRKWQSWDSVSGFLSLCQILCVASLSSHHISFSLERWKSQERYSWTDSLAARLLDVAPSVPMGGPDVIFRKLIRSHTLVACGCCCWGVWLCKCETLLQQKPHFMLPNLGSPETDALGMWQFLACIIIPAVVVWAPLFCIS